MSYAWMKLYVELLDDPKVGLMPDWVFRRFIQFLLCATERNQAGLLGPVSELAWRLRSSEEDVLSALRTMSEIGIVRETGDGWLVMKFAKRQASLTSTERSQKSRQRPRNEDATTRCINGDEDATPPSSSTSPSDSESPEGGGAGEGDAGAAYAAWADNSVRDCARLYTQVTNQIAIPYDQQNQALHDLDTVLFGYFGGDIEKAAAAGKRVFGKWCQTQSKSNGKKYSPTNTAWITWWLAEGAPRPVGSKTTLLDKVLEDLNG